MGYEQEKIIRRMFVDELGFTPDSEKYLTGLKKDFDGTMVGATVSWESGGSWLRGPGIDVTFSIEGIHDSFMPYQEYMGEITVDDLREAMNKWLGYRRQRVKNEMIKLLRDHEALEKVSF